MSPTPEAAASAPAGAHRVVLFRRSIVHALDSSDLLALSLERLERNLTKKSRRRGRPGRLSRSTAALRGSQAALVSAAQSLRRSALAVVPSAAQAVN